jgi:hypothetical protein
VVTGKKAKSKRTAARAYPQIAPTGERPAPPELKARRKDKLDDSRQRWREAIARTRAAQAEIDARIKGVRLGKGPGVIRGTPRARAEPEEIVDVIRERGTPRARAEPEEIVDVIRERAPMAPPVEYDRSAIHQEAAQQPRPKIRITRPPDDSDGRIGLSRCSLCGKPGHNRKRHTHEPKCLHNLPWSLCRLCLRTASTASGPSVSLPSAP